jgi:hypothetical protein
MYLRTTTQESAGRRFSKYTTPDRSVPSTITIAPKAKAVFRGKYASEHQSNLRRV